MLIFAIVAVSDHQLGHGLQPLGRLLAHRLVQFPVPPLALAAAIGDHWQIDSRALSTDSLFVEELNCVWPNCWLCFLRCSRCRMRAPQQA